MGWSPMCRSVATVVSKSCWGYILDRQPTGASVHSCIYNHMHLKNVISCIYISNQSIKHRLNLFSRLGVTASRVIWIEATNNLTFQIECRRVRFLCHEPP